MEEIERLRSNSQEDGRCDHSPYTQDRAFTDLSIDFRSASTSSSVKRHGRTQLLGHSGFSAARGRAAITPSESYAKLCRSTIRSAGSCGSYVAGTRGDAASPPPLRLGKDRPDSCQHRQPAEGQHRRRPTVMQPSSFQTAEVLSLVRGLPPNN